MPLEEWLIDDDKEFEEKLKFKLTLYKTSHFVITNYGKFYFDIADNKVKFNPSHFADTIEKAVSAKYNYGNWIERSHDDYTNQCMYIKDNFLYIICKDDYYKPYQFFIFKNE